MTDDTDYDDDDAYWWAQEMVWKAYERAKEGDDDAE